MRQHDQSPNTVAVIGGGCSGLLVVTHLLRRSTQPIDLVLIEPAASLGGLAYSTEDPRHRLNVPACEMSAFSDAPDDFVNYLATEGRVIDPDCFVERSAYRAYLASLPSRARAEAHPLSEVEWIGAAATALVVRETEEGARVRIGLENGAHIEAAHAVLALGVPPPGLNVDAADLGPLFIADPWAPGALDNIAGEVLLIGTGLTAIDVAVGIEHHGRVRRILARSRHGLLPATHDAESRHLVPERPRLQPTEWHSAREVLRALRESVDKVVGEGGSWQEVIAELRPSVPAIWGALPQREQERVLRHLLRYWEIHRHRMPPATAQEVARLRASGALGVGRGTLVSIEREGRRCRVQLRSGPRTETLRVDVVIDCTGPARDYGRTSALARHLLTSGLAQRGPFGIGLATDAEGHLRGADGTVRPYLHTIGWARRGTLLESTAVPELRRQAEALATRLTEAKA